MLRRAMRSCPRAAGWPAVQRRGIVDTAIASRATSAPLPTETPAKTLHTKNWKDKASEEILETMSETESKIYFTHKAESVMAHGRIRPWMETWITLFTHMHGSTTETGRLNLSKFTTLIKMLEPVVEKMDVPALTDAQIDGMFTAIDLDNNGLISADELDAASKEIHLARDIREKTTQELPWNLPWLELPWKYNMKRLTSI